MPRTKTGVVRRRRHQGVLKLTKGFRGTNSRLIKRAQEALLHSGQYAFIGRKLRKRDMRKLWIMRINAAARQVDPDLTYSKFMNLLKKAQIVINRKMLSEIAVSNPSAFKSVVKQVRE